MKAIHAHLFQDVYDWAGEFRTVDMAKKGQAFADYDGDIRRLPVVRATFTYANTVAEIRANEARSMPFQSCSSIVRIAAMRREELRLQR